MRARVYLFEAADVASVFARLFALRKDLTGPTRPPDELPFSAAFAAHEQRANRRWVESPGFFAAGARDSAYSTWQTGRCGGLLEALPLLAAGEPQSRERATATVDFAVVRGQAGSGFFHGVSDGKIWFDDGFSAPLPGRKAPPAYKHARRWHLVRRSADALTVLMRQVLLMERRQPEDKADARWTRAARRAADGFVKLWDRYHQLGQFVDVETGQLVVGGSTAAGLAPAGLALAAGYFKEPRYLEVGKAAAEHFYERYVRVGLTCGGPGDALQCPDSESAAALLDAFMTLHEVTRDRIWIDRARVAAHLLASWVVAFDPVAGAGAGRGTAAIARDAPGPCAPEPDGSGRAAGAVLGDAQSRRCAPGFVTSSGSALFRLYRATGDVALLELLRDTVRGLARHAPPTTEGLARARLGRTEECPPADAAAIAGDGYDPRAAVVPAAGVLDGIALLTYTEVPGLYAQVDKGFVFAFDHVDVKIKGREGGGSVPLVGTAALVGRDDDTVAVVETTRSNSSFHWTGHVTVR